MSDGLQPSIHGLFGRHRKIPYLVHHPSGDVYPREDFPHLHPILDSKTIFIAEN